MTVPIFSPLGKKTPNNIRTSNTLIQQVWQEFVMLRHVRSRHIAAPKSIAQWIDQARTYFLDATQSNWRSAGLLYYYSFLNLAKAYLVAKRVFTYKTLDATSIYHGLRADPQKLSNIADFEIQIYPPSHNGRKNIFATLYETVSGQDWPYTDKISIKLAEVLGYCGDVSLELKSLFNIEKQIIPVQSLLRFYNNEIWFEMAVPNYASTTVQQQVKDWKLEAVSGSNLSNLDKNDWLSSLNVTARDLSYGTCLRNPKKSYSEENAPKLIYSVINEAEKYLEQYAFPPVAKDINFPCWYFIPKINLVGKSVLWHPILSDYLFSFALSLILRYQPQLLDPKTPNYFFAEAWCSQAPLSTLRHFLMLFTHPPLTIETY